MTSKKIIILCALKPLRVINVNQLMIFEEIIDEVTDVHTKHKKEIVMKCI